MFSSVPNNRLSLISGQQQGFMAEGKLILNQKTNENIFVLLSKPLNVVESRKFKFTIWWIKSLFEKLQYCHLILKKISVILQIAFLKFHYLTMPSKIYHLFTKIKPLYQRKFSIIKHGTCIGSLDFPLKPYVPLKKYWGDSKKSYYLQ